MALSGPFDVWTANPLPTSMSGPIDHFADALPARTLSGPFDATAAGIPGRSLSGPFDHPAEAIPSSLSGPFDHYAEEDVPPPPPGAAIVSVSSSPLAGVEAGFAAFLPTDFSVRRAYEGPQIIIEWGEPLDPTDVTSIRLVRRRYGFPQNEVDGEIIFDGPPAPRS